MRVYASSSTPTTNNNSNTVTQQDMDVIRTHFQFLRDDNADAERGASDWQVRMSVRYYRKLFREYALVDLARYQEGKIGLRWRTESEVVAGKGQFACGNKRCDISENLHSYELLFAYMEQGEKKRCLVKVRVCEACAQKIFYKKLQLTKAGTKKRKNQKKKRRRGDSDLDSHSDDEQSDRENIHTLCGEINAREATERGAPGGASEASSLGFFEDRSGENDSEAFRDLLL